MTAKKPRTTTKKTVTKTTTKKTATKTTEKTTAKKTRAKKAPLSTSTWHLLHIKLVGETLDKGFAAASMVPSKVTSHWPIKQRVFAFLRTTIQVGVKVVTKFSIKTYGGEGEDEDQSEDDGENNTEKTRRGTTMRIVDATTGNVELECRVDLGLVGPWAWSPS